MKTGVIKFFEPVKNFGFIMPHDGGKDVFFHRSAMEGAMSFNPGQWVQFELFEGFPDQKPRAMRVAACAKRGEYVRGEQREKVAQFGTN